ncbi:MAG: YciI family protein [Betaproteobacteria bacterium]|nr:YciI family protein [Betaproteobacteria bacterium]
MHYLLFYDVVTDYTTARTPYRKSHLLHAMAAHQRGEIILAGALTNPADGAVLVFQGDSPKVAEDFASADPYVLNGVVTSWRVREWNTVVGDNPALVVDPNTL